MGKKKAAEAGGKEEAMIARGNATLREAYARIEAKPAPRRLVEALDRLFGARRSDSRN